MHVSRTVNLPVEELMKLVICPLLCLERTLTVFTHHPRTAKSERFDPRFFCCDVFYLLNSPILSSPYKHCGISMLLLSQFDLDFSYLISELIHASWRSDCCHFPLSGGTLSQQGSSLIFAVTLLV